MRSSKRLAGSRCELGTVASATTRHTAPAAACNQKIVGQDPSDAIWPPISGANTGDRNVTIAIHDSARDACSPRHRSSTIARASTLPDDAPSPCRNRQSTSVARLCASAAMTPATT